MIHTIHNRNRDRALVGHQNVLGDVKTTAIRREGGSFGRGVGNCGCVSNRGGISDRRGIGRSGGYCWGCGVSLCGYIGSCKGISAG